MNHLLQGRHRLDMVPGDPLTGVQDDDAIYYWKFLDETEIPFMTERGPMAPRFYIWKWKEDNGDEESCSVS